MDNKIMMIVAVVAVIILIAVGVMYSKPGDNAEPLPATTENSAAVASPVSANEAEINALEVGGEVDASFESVDAQINSL